ncbi:MAG TPA: hypothetical protein VIS06_12435 [Mycobacteriales bacterium]
MTDRKPTDIGWAILEVLGQRCYAGYITTTDVAGTPMVRITIPGCAPLITTDDTVGPEETRYFKPALIESITTVAEDTARFIAGAVRMGPLYRHQVETVIAAGPCPDDPSSAEETDRG